MITPAGRNGAQPPRGVRYLAFRCARGLELLSTEAMRDAFADQLEATHARGAFRLFAWAVLPDHVELLLAPEAPKWTAPKVVQAIKQPFAQKVLQRWRDAADPMLGVLADGSGQYHFWEHGRLEDRRVASAPELAGAIERIHAGPVRRGFAGQPHQWRWSSAGWYQGRRDTPVTIDPIDRAAA